jgi:hypothetical protein
MQYIFFLTVINILILILHKWNTDKAVVRYIVRNWFYFLFLGLPWDLENKEKSQILTVTFDDCYNCYSFYGFNF